MENYYEKKVWKGKIKNRKKNGEFYIVETVIAPLLDSDSNIREFLSIRHDVTEITEKQQEIEKLAHTNFLTELPNRFALNKTLSSTTSGSIALVDINSFHEINDFYGENVGDKVIKAVAKQLEIQLSDDYQLFHLQGDQFIILDRKSVV